MEMVTDIAVDDAFVIHVLDTHLPDVQCSQALTPLPDTLRTTLHKYLLSLLKPQFRRKRYGRFQPDAVVLHAYRQMLTSLEQHPAQVMPDFLAASQRIATRLFQVMLPSAQNGARTRPGAVTPGDLLIGLFRAIAPTPSSTPWLFLVKVDLESALQRQLRPIGNGGVQTTLTQQTALIPKLSTEKVHKFALIRWANDPTTYDVLMADPQGGKPEIAKFFAEDFLQTEPFRTADEQAELLCTRTFDWVAAHEEALSPQERSAVLQTVRSVLTERVASATPIAPRELAASLPLLEPRPQHTVAELRQSFTETLTAPDNDLDTIPIDQEILIQAIPRSVQKTRVTYQLDFGVQLSGDQDAIERLLVSPPRHIGNVTELTLRTTTFRPIL